MYGRYDELGDASVRQTFDTMCKKLGGMGGNIDDDPTIWDVPFRLMKFGGSAAERFLPPKFLENVALTIPPASLEPWWLDLVDVDDNTTSLETLDAATQQPGGLNGANIIEEDGVQRQGSKRQGQGDLELVPTRLAMSTPYFYNPRQTRGYAMTNWLQGTSVPRPSPHPHPRPMSISNIALVFEPMCACV